MRVGVNYVPRKNWFYSWLDLNLDDVKQDMADIASVGLDHVRIFPLWQMMQPNASLILPEQVARVRGVAQVAVDAGLDVTVDVLQGHLSSFDFLPSWVVTWHRRNIFTDPDVIAAQIRLIQALASALSDMPGVRGLSVGNEIVQFAAPRHVDPCLPSAQQVHEWLAQIMGAMREAWPQGEHTFSYDDDVLFESDHPFGADLLASFGDQATVHSWIFGILGQTLGVDHPRLKLLARYLLELTAAWAPGKPLWLQEVGAPLNYLTREAVPTFVHDTLTQAAAVPGIEAVTWWCSHDVSRDLADFPAVEYDLGLFTSEGELKPAGQALQDWIKNPQIAKWPGGDRLAIPAPTDPGARQAVRPDGVLFDQWATALEAGHPKTLEVR